MAFAPRSMKSRNKKGLALPTTEPRQPQNGFGEAQAHASSGAGNRRRNDQEQPLEIGLELTLDLRNEDLIVLKELGAGNGGTVSLVQHAATKAIMARKIIHVEAKQEVRKRIVTELGIMRECTSPYIISFYGAFMNDSGDVVISLDTISKTFGPVRVDVLGKIAEAILAGLTYLYSAHRIMHRDIKPSNVLVNSKGNIKLCDFGVSSELVNSVADTFVGTGTYMAPERIQGSPYTVKSDVWSVGLTLMELAIGKFPFAPDYDANGEEIGGPQGILDLLQQIVMEPSPKLPKSDAFPQILEDMIGRCLMKEPELRPTPQELYEYDAFIQAAKRTPVDLQAWALSLMGNDSRKPQIPIPLTPVVKDTHNSQRSSPALSLPLSSPGYGDIPIGNLTLNSDGTAVHRAFPTRTSSVIPRQLPYEYQSMNASAYSQGYPTPTTASSASLNPPRVPEKPTSPYPVDTRRQNNSNRYGSYNDRTYF